MKSFIWHGKITGRWHVGPNRALLEVVHAHTEEGGYATLGEAVDATYAALALTPS